MSMDAPDMDERRKRAKIRAWRRGMKEMDLILGPFADTAEMDDATLCVFEALLEEPDQEMYTWFTGREKIPERYESLVARIASHQKI